MSAMIAFDSERAADIQQTAHDHIDAAQQCLQRYLTWVDGVPDERRDAVRRALNALELADCRLRGVFKDLPVVASLL